jgi:hypothetical protein
MDYGSIVRHDASFRRAQMQTKPKSNSIITHERTAAGIAFKFRGNTLGELLFNLLHADVRERAMIHGLIQRVGDGGAVERLDASTGTIRTDDEMDAIKMARMKTLINHYNSGTADWNVARGLPKGPDNSGLTIEAISRVYGWDIPTVEAKVTKMATEKGIERKAMLATYGNIPDVAAMIGTIKAERAAHTGLDAVGMADELMRA